MGRVLFDRFTFLHALSGAVANRIGLKLAEWFVIHTVFELIENSRVGMAAINHLYYWPGGKPEPDTVTNMIGDTFGAVLGWLIAEFLCLNKSIP